MVYKGFNSPHKSGPPFVASPYYFPLRRMTLKVPLSLFAPSHHKTPYIVSFYHYFQKANQG